MRLGELVVDDPTDHAQPKDFGVAQRIPHPQYSDNSYYYDIMLLRLNDSVKFSPHMRPTCLWPFPDTSSLTNEHAIITGWGQPKLGN